MKHKLDIHSIKFRVCIYFIIFAVILMVVLWSLQVLFLNPFYQSMKTTKTQSVAKDIELAYQNHDPEEFMRNLYDIAEANDMYIYIATTDNTPYFISNKDNTSRDYTNEMAEIHNTLVNNNTRSISKVIGEKGQRSTLACGSILSAKGKNTLFAYIFSPLFPLSSTLEILTTQLVFVTSISLVMALLLAFYLATKITTPIRAINKSAKQLAQGEYGVVFTGGQYTELNNLADTLTKASIQLEKSAMLQKDLIANVSHDLRTPLTMVKSYAEMIRDLSGENPKKRNSHLQVIIDEADRLNVLVGDMLTLSRMQSGALTLERENFNLRDVVEGILLTYKLLMEQDGYDIQLNCKSDITVNADIEKMKQVFSNLINNALKFCGPDKVVEINIKRKGRYVLCQVVDHGIGIKAEELPHIWERYYRASSNMVRASSGSGLGLSIIKEILSLHKSNFGVTSTVGEGTTFWFELDAISK